MFRARGVPGGPAGRGMGNALGAVVGAGAGPDRADIIGVPGRHLSGRLRRAHPAHPATSGAALEGGACVNRKLKCPLFRILKCPLVDKEIAVSIILCISPYLATVPVSLQAHVPTTRPCASLSTGNSPP